MLTAEQVQSIRQVIAEQLAVDLDEVTDAATLRDLDADSLDLVEVTIVLEDQFNVKMPYEEVEKMRTVGDLVRYFEANGR